MTLLYSLFVCTILLSVVSTQTTFQALNGGTQTIGASLNSPVVAGDGSTSEESSGELFFTANAGNSVYEFVIADSSFPADLSTLSRYNASAPVSSVLSFDDESGVQMVTIVPGATPVLNVVDTFLVVNYSCSLPAGIIGGGAIAFGATAVVWTSSSIYTCDITVGGACDCSDAIGGFSSYIGSFHSDESFYMLYISATNQLLLYDLSTDDGTFKSTMVSPNPDQPFFSGSYGGTSVFVVSYNAASASNTAAYVIEIGATDNFVLTATYNLGQIISLPTLYYDEPSTAYGITGTTSQMYIIDTAGMKVCPLNLNGLTNVIPVSILGIGSEVYIGSSPNGGDAYLFRAALPLATTNTTCSTITLNTTTTTTTSISTSSTASTTSTSSTSSHNATTSTAATATSTTGAVAATSATSSTAAAGTTSGSTTASAAAAAATTTTTSSATTTLCSAIGVFAVAVIASIL